MSLCYDFQKWTVLTMLPILTVCLAGMINLVYGQQTPEGYAQLASIQNTIRQFKMTINYCYEHADSVNPVQDLVDKGFVPDFNGKDCKTIEKGYQAIWDSLAQLIAEGRIKDQFGTPLTMEQLETILNGGTAYVVPKIK